MGITLARIANNSAKVTFMYGEDEVTIEYFPGHVTERTFAQLQEFSRMEGADLDKVIGAFQKLNEMLAGTPIDAGDLLEGKRPPIEALGLLKSWDVLEDNGVTMFPIEADHLSLLPIPFRLAVLQAIMGDIRPNQVPTQK
jgi:hypothetical protein